MTDDSRSPFGMLGDMVDAIFGDGPTAKKRQAPESPASAPTLRSRTIDGVPYVRADDVAQLLELTVPVKARNLIKKLRSLGESK